MTQWDGITIAGDRVTELRLSNKGLTGTIPAELGDLSGLTAIYMSSNDSQRQHPRHRSATSPISAISALRSTSFASRCRHSSAISPTLETLYLSSNFFLQGPAVLVREPHEPARAGAVRHRLARQHPVPAGKSVQSRRTPTRRQYALRPHSLAARQSLQPQGAVPHGQWSQRQHSGLARQSDQPHIARAQHQRTHRRYPHRAREPGEAQKSQTRPQQSDRLRARNVVVCLQTRLRPARAPVLPRQADLSDLGIRTAQRSQKARPWEPPRADP